MHVAIVTPNLHGGGAEAVARQWIAELQAEGHSITVYAYAREQPDVELPHDVVSHRMGRHGGPLRPVLMPWWLAGRIRRDTPDVVLSLMTFSNVVSLLALKLGGHSTVPLMVSEHNVQSLQTVNLRRRERLTVWLARRLYRFATGALAVSHPVAAELVSAFRVPAQRIFVVPNPVLSSSEATAAAPAHQLPKDLHLVLVGRHAEQKRPQLFLEVLQDLAHRGVSVRGSVIGDGPLREATEQKSSQLGLDVAFLGWREPWWEAVSNVDCLVLTANAEGLANVLVEAASAGIPSVASSRALGVADAIVPGVTGELALGDNPRSYADAVLRAAPLVLTSPIEIRAWLNHFSSAHSTATLLAALEAVKQ
ncbi:MAG TPA: glycosyltransferase [Solirubrobacteraceae bacterium]|nr:glycosyltransferase [Solirubrobacteraceae bacterium]